MAQEIGENKDENFVDNVENDSKLSKERKEKGSPNVNKVVIRRLPPTMTEEQFLEQISPIPEHDYFSYVNADYSLGQNAFCVAYINFLNPEEVFLFKDQFDDYVFIDSKGNEFPAVVEFAPFQKIPKKRNRKDVKCGTIEQDPDYKAFLEALQNPAEVSLPTIEAYLEEIEAKERDLKANHGVPPMKTPLLEYVKQRKLEKQRIRDEKREERRRREAERRKQREEGRLRRKQEREKKMSEKCITEKNENDKESKTEENSDGEVVVKVLKNPERKATGKSSKGQSKKNDRKSLNSSSDVNKPESSKKKHEVKDDEKQKSKSESSKKYKDKQHVQSKESKSPEDKGKYHRKKSPDRKKTENKRHTIKVPNNSKLNCNANESDSCDNKDGASSKCERQDRESDEGSHSNDKILCSDRPTKSSRIKDEKRIRNKDRPSMELYRPGVHRLAVKSQSTSPNKEASPTSSDSSSPTANVATKSIKK